MAYSLNLHLTYGVKKHELPDLLRRAHAGIRHVAGQDPDRARLANGVGFSASDQTVGHCVANIPVELFLKSEILATLLLRLAVKYRRQMPVSVNLQTPSGSPGAGKRSGKRRQQKPSRQGQLSL